MTDAVTLEIVLEGLAMAFALMSYASRDNFYSALYMCLTMMTIAGIYAFYGVHSAFALITLIFIGALGIITVVLSYSFREIKSIDYRFGWIVFALIVSFVSLTLPNFANAGDYVDAIPSFEPIYMLIALPLILMLVLIEVWRDGL